MSSIQVLKAAARCSARAQRQCAGSTSVRCLATAASDKRPLETIDDWTNFQVERAEYKTLVDHFSNYGSSQTSKNTFQPRHSLTRPVAPSKLTLSALLASGAHFGHSKTLMNPNFMPYAYGVRAGITVIDLDQTLPMLRRAAKLVRAVAVRDGTVVFVGTRPDLREAVRKAAEAMGSQGYHVGEKWLPGTLTNKLELLGYDSVKRERVIPDLVVFLNPIPNMHAIRECAIENVPTIGIVDSNVDPRVVMYPIPANDESTRTAHLIVGVLGMAGREGVAIRQEEEGGRRSQQESNATRSWRARAKTADIV